MPETVSDTRRNLSRHLQRFREEGVDAEPVVFGSNRRPDAALLPYEMFELLLELAEDIVIAQRVREHEAMDSGNRTFLADVAAELDVDLGEL